MEDMFSKDSDSEMHAWLTVEHAILINTVII